MKVGDKVVCVISKSFWEVGIGPDKGDIVTIKEVHINPEGTTSTYFVLQEFPSDKFYRSDSFRPIDYTFGEKIVECITKECEETVNV